MSEHIILYEGRLLLESPKVADGESNYILLVFYEHPKEKLGRLEIVFSIKTSSGK